MQAEFAADKPQLRRRNELLMDHRHSMELAIEIARPEVEKILEARETRMDVVLLPDVRLQERWMIWHPVEDLCRRHRHSMELAIVRLKPASCARKSQSGNPVMGGHLTR